MDQEDLDAEPSLGQDGGLDGSQGVGRTGEARGNDHGGKPGQTESTDEEVTFFQDGPPPELAEGGSTPRCSHYEMER